MVIVHIYYFNGERDDVVMVEDSEDYESLIQSIETDPFVEGYSITSL